LNRLGHAQRCRVARFDFLCRYHKERPRYSKMLLSRNRLLSILGFWLSGVLKDHSLPVYLASQTPTSRPSSKSLQASLSIPFPVVKPIQSCTKTSSSASICRYHKETP
jgi:hypothetical protein